MSPQYICFDKYWSSGVSRVNEWNSELPSDYIVTHIRNPFGFLYK